MDYQLIRAYCAKDLNGILKPRDKWYSTPQSRFEELELQILFKHRTGVQNLEPRQYAAVVCLRALEMLDIPFLADGNYPEFTQADSIETGRVTLADALNDYIPHLLASEAAPLLPLNAELQQFKSTTSPQQTAQATAAAPAPPESKEQRQDRRLQACIDAGLPMLTMAALSRLPDGVAKVADGEGVSRQTFSIDVKGALQRRKSAIRGANLPHFL